MHFVVTGSRTWRKRLLLWRILDNRYRRHGELYLWYGKCPKGADQMAEEWALNRIGRGWEVYLCPIPVDHDQDGPWPRAGMVRNARMLRHYQDRCGMRTGRVLAFNRHDSPGTTGCVKKAEALDMHVQVWRDDD